MRTFAGLFSLLFLAAGSAAIAGEPANAEPEVIRLSEPVEVTDSYEVFGAPMRASGPALRLAALVEDSERYLDSEVLVTTRVAKVCRKKGCFFIAQDGETVARVTFKDYEFFIPTDSGGKEVTLAGVFRRGELSEKQARHYQKDLGESGRGSPAAGMEYQIVATSVRIPRS